MRLESVAELLILKGNVTGRTVESLPRLYLHQSPVESRLKQSLHALLVADLAGFSSDEETPNYHKGSLQLIVSSDVYGKGYDLAVELSKDLTLYGEDLDDVYIYRCVPRHLPVSYRKNEQNVTEFSVNFDLVIRNK